MELLVDGVLVVFAVWAVVRGARQGAIVAAGAAVGSIGGLWLGIVMAPGVLSAAESLWSGTLSRVVAALIVVLAIDLVCIFACDLAARWLSRIVTRVPGGRTVDIAAGAVFGFLSWAILVWLVAGMAVSSGVLALSQLAESSSIVTTLNKVVPLSTSQVFGTVDDAFEAAGLPEVFSAGEGSVVSVADVPTSTPAVVTALSASVLKVDAEKPSCGLEATGSGWPLSDNEVVTNAHVVAGASTVTVQEPGSSRVYSATVVLYDPEVDVAVLYVSGLDATAFTVDTAAASSGTAVYGIGYPGGGSLTITPGRIRSSIDAIGLDIYNSQTVTRSVYSLRAEIRAGDSGGPLLNESGEVIGMVFARSSVDSETGYALTASQVDTSLASLGTSTAAVSTGACSAD